MYMHKWKSLLTRSVDMPLFIAVIALCVISMAVLYSAGGENIGVLGNQALRIGIGLSLMLVVAHIPPGQLAARSPALYMIGTILLIVVLIVGIVNKGAQRWLDFGIFRFQPSEIMKIFIPMMVAWVLSRTPLPSAPSRILLALLLTLVPVVLVILQPDLGTAILIGFSGLLVIFLAGISWKILLVMIGAFGVALPLLWDKVLYEYQQVRILSLLDPWADPLGSGYHTIQSIIAVGSGGMFGKGWLSGTQTQLDFIPERNTDFVFAVYAEEFGFFGSLVLLSLYLFIGLRGLHIAYHAHSTYSRLLAACLSITFFCYTFVNVGMVVGILPVVGVPLPLLSHGGSLMVTMMIGLGILMSIQRYK